jgi:glutaredoxin
VTIELTLISKPGCHLCDDALEVIHQVLADFSAAKPQQQVEVKHVNMLEHEDLIQKYAEEIPVLLINGNMHAYWRIDDERLMRALHALAK